MNKRDTVFIIQVVMATASLLSFLMGKSKEWAENNPSFTQKLFWFQKEWEG